MATDAQYLYVVMMDVEPDKEAEFNEIYNKEHIPVLLQVPGVLGAARYETSTPGYPKYVAIKGKHAAVSGQLAAHIFPYLANH